MQSFDTVELEKSLEDLMYQLIHAYLKFSGKREIPTSIYSVHRELVLKYKETTPLIIVDFFRILTEKPLREIFITSVSSNPLFNNLYDTLLFSNAT